MENIFIILDNPRDFAPGQVVSGRVAFRNEDVQCIKGISLQFEGKATCHWRERTYFNNHQFDNNNRRPRTISFNSSEQFLKSEMHLLGDGETDISLSPGERYYPFAFQLPTRANLLNSYKGEYGKVEYVLRATAKRSPWKLDYTARQVVFVRAVVDLNKVFGAAFPGEWEESKQFCCFCCASGTLSVTVKTPKRGYAPGEIIDLEMDVANQSGKVINDLSCEILQTVTFITNDDTKVTYKRFMHQRRSQTGEPFDSENWSWRTFIQVPELPPTNLGGCGIIHLEYTIEVEVHVAGTALNLTGSCPITIGTIPIQQRGHEQQHVTAPLGPPIRVELS